MTGRLPIAAVAAVLLFGLPGCRNQEGRDSGARPAERAAAPTVAAAVAGVPPAHFDQIVELYNKGVGLMDQYQPVEAVKAFDEMVQLAPEWTTGRLNLGIALLNAQSDEAYARAETELKRVAAAEPDNPYAHYALGMLLRHFTRFDEARARFERVLEIDPEDADAHYQLGILLIDTDPAAARTHLERTLQRVPHHESACYRLRGLLIKAGEEERAQELLSRFRDLKASGAGVFSGMKYGEMGRYADVVRAFETPALPAQENAAPAYGDVAESAGFALAAAGTAGWPGEGPRGSAATFAPGVAVADMDGDGDLDVYIPALGPGGGGRLYRNEGGRFADVGEAGIDGGGAIGAFWGDYDGDGDPDLYLTRAGPNRLYRNDGGGRFSDVTVTSGTGGGDVVSVGAAWADADHDGDLDLYVANVAAVAGGGDGDGAPNALWRNNGDDTFTDVAASAGIDGGDTASLGVTFLDADEDRDLDVFVVNGGGANRLYLNDRVGRYTDGGSRFRELAESGSGLGAVAGDVDGDGREDLLVLRGKEPPRLFLHLGRDRFAEDTAFAGLVREGAVGGLLADLDLDGDLDLVLLDAGGDEHTQHRVLMNRGGGRFGPPAPFGEVHAQPSSRGAVAADLDADGSLDLLVARVGARPELWRAPAPEGRHWLEVVPVKTGEEQALWADPGAVGLAVEVKTGRQLRVASVTSSAGYLGGTPPRVHFGLGAYGKADYVRLAWPDAVIQSELEVAADQRWRLNKISRKPSSCPVLFAWDGERFAFVTDFLGVGGLGFFVAPGVYAPPDPTEDVRIPPELLVPRNGRYALRVAEPLEEVVYLDQLHLVAYDHPAAWEVYPDERFAVEGPAPTGRPFAVAKKVWPVAARDDRGTDVLERLRAIDRRYAEPPVLGRLVGYARDHWVEIDFGDRLRGRRPDARLVLYLYGWVEYTYSHVNYAAHQAGLAMRAPSIEVPDGAGGWRVAMAEVGYPAGLPRMMTVDISSLPLDRDGRLRIRTNMEVFWDQVFAAEDVAGPELRARTLAPVVAELRSLGYPREYSPDGADPTIYDYHRVDQGVPFKNLRGDYTCFGDVRELLAAADDRFVIMGRGEEIALEFDAGELSPPPEGWARTFVLHTDGYCKDMDLYTAFPDTVKPLPYHAMPNYPPPEPGPAVSVEAPPGACGSRRISG